MELSKLKILITGSNGFIAKNLIIELKNRGYENLLLCNRDTDSEGLVNYLAQCDVLVHLAGVNRPVSEEEYFTENVGFTEKIIEVLRELNKKIHIIFSSTIQAGRHKCYEESKRNAERILQEYAAESGSLLSIFRLPNVFGKWCRPNYNSVVATFCYNVSHNLDIRVDNPTAEIKLVYIDDVVNEMISCLEEEYDRGRGYVEISEAYLITVDDLAHIIRSFKQVREMLTIPDLSNLLVKKLYSTYLSYLESDDYCYRLNMNKDERGSFTEFLRSKESGQVSVNIAKPGVVKGDHWHHTKIEKFLVVKGTASIKFRHMITGKVFEFIVSGKELVVVDIPVGYTHNITNIGADDLITVMWANEPFNKEQPDTYYEEV